MSKAKQNPCEVAWNAYRIQPSDLKGETPCSAFVERAFFAGFRAGEEGKAELLEALKDAAIGLEKQKQTNWTSAHSRICCALRYEKRVRAAIAKHTAK